MKNKINLVQMCLLGAVIMQALAGLAQPTVTAVAAGPHTLFLKSDSSFWGMGYNADGELGNGTTNNVLSPLLIVTTNVTAIAAGGAHSLFIKSDGSLWAMGNNSSGQLGDGTFSTARMIPEMVVALGVKAIAAGTYHSLYITKSGVTTRLWAMGQNGVGELGDGTTSNRATAVNILSGNPATSPVVTAIAAGDDFSLFIKSDGSLWGMGSNLHGELGLNTNGNPSQPTEIVTTGVTAIAAGSDFSLFIKNDGSLWAMGDNNSGALGTGDYHNSFVPVQILGSGVKAIACGSGHSLFLKNDGSLWAMGEDVDGALGDGLGDFGTNRPVEIVSGGVTAITAGNGDTLFVRDGNLWATGNNQYGALGDGTTDQGLYQVNSPELIVAGPTPTAGIGTYDNQPVVFFPTTGVNYVVQMSTNLSSGNWLAVTNGTPISGIIITNATGTAFFRLQTP